MGAIQYSKSRKVGFSNLLIGSFALMKADVDARNHNAHDECDVKQAVFFLGAFALG